MSANGRLINQKDKIINYKIVRKGGLFFVVRSARPTELINLRRKLRPKALIRPESMDFDNGPTV